MEVTVIKTVYVFGAGASAADKAPTVPVFLQVAHSLLKHEIQLKKLWTFLEEYYSRDFNQTQNICEDFPAIDEVISTIDWAIANKITLLPSHDPLKNVELQKLLIHLMSETLRLSLLNVKESVHEKFIRNLKMKEGKYEANIISLNYDLLLDRAIKEISGKEPHYGLTKTMPAQRIRLYKLHGSLNWQVCSFCQKIIVIKSPITTCPKCSSPHLQPVLVTPTILKSYDIPDLSQIWNEAFQTISEAEKVVFIGYSLPPADFAIIERIKRAIHQGGKRPKIHVVDYKNESVPVRYKQIFGSDVTSDLSGFSGEAY